MTGRCACGTRFTGRAPWLSVSLTCLLTPGLAPGRVSGTARNLSRNEPASGDEVILLCLDRGMQEQARAKADALGAFVFPREYPDRFCLVRVMHQGVGYDQQVSTRGIVVDVFDAAPRVQNIAGTIEILRTGTEGTLLHVSDMYEIENRSNPPLTQASERTLEVYLPPGAKMASVLAAAPGKIGVEISASPVAGEPGRYAVNFPLLPGATKFAFNYDLPYDGHAVFRTRRLYPLQQLAIMIPPTMRFSSSSAAFQSLPTGNARYQAQVANELSAGDGPGFEVSGTGAIPPIGGPASPPSARSLPPTRPPESPGLRRAEAGADSPSEPEPSSSQSSVLAGVTVALLGVCIVLVWHARKRTRIRGQIPTSAPDEMIQRIQPSRTATKT